MTEFQKFKEALQLQFKSMTDGQDQLFLTDVSKDEIWDTYLESFPEGSNDIYKERREFDCNSCRQFIRPFGNVVAVKDNELVSIWDIPDLEFPFKIVAEKLSKLVKSAKIRSIFVTKFEKLGINKNRQLLEDKTVKTWDHLYFKIPKKFKDNSDKSIENVQGNFKGFRDVFERSMRELTIDSGQTVLELIDQGSLYRGEEHKTAVTKFIKYKTEYDKVPENLKDNWCWINTANNSIAKIRNNAIGTLLIDISDEMDLDKAVSKFERNVMAPANYKRPKDIFTKKMVENAEKKIVELGFSESLERRFAVLEDITVNNVLFVNHDAKKKLNGSVFDDLKNEVPENSKKFNKIEEVSIEDFVKNIIPTSTNIELMMEGRHQSNLMSLIAPKNKDAKSMLKWNNNFSWAYNGDITDSMKQNVKKAGGNVEGVLRFSIQWNENNDNQNDFDAHCIEPNGNEIYFSNMKNRYSTGVLDVDIVQPSGVAVENITWTNINKMEEGKYKFFVLNYAHRGGTSGFRAEIEYDGQVYAYDYPKDFKNKGIVNVAEIMFTKKDGIKFLKSLDNTATSKEVWNVNTNKFVKVSVAMFSPNYWDMQKGIDNKHYFFFLEGCENEVSPRGFFNEFLNNDLMEHKRVFEALGSKMRVEPSDNQLSGLGFSSTQRNSIIAKVEGSFARTIKINF